MRPGEYAGADGGGFTMSIDAHINNWSHDYMYIQISYMI